MPLKKGNTVSKARWLAAQEQERKAVERAEDIKEWINVRRQTWAGLLDSLKGDLTISDSMRILDVGGGPTSIFLALREGEKYAVDSNIEHLLQYNPFIKEVAEYRDVRFISSSIEGASFDKPFDVIFMINVLDHVGELKPVTDKINELLKPAGMLVVVVDCYADVLVRNIISFFDPDPPHPHHFMVGDIYKLFSPYKVKRQDSGIFKLMDEPPFRGRGSEIEPYRIDKFFKKMRTMLASLGKEKDILFIIKFVFCYSLALVTAFVRRQEKPIYPFKKARLFVFQKP